MKHPFFFIVPAAALALAACSDHSDDEKYSSIPPRFADLTLHNLSDGTTEYAYAGEKFVLTAVQSKLGKLLNRTTYEWTSTSPFSETIHAYKKALLAGYDNERQNPTDTVIIKQPGTYKVTLKARYNNSGNVVAWTNKYGYGVMEEDLENGTRVKYNLPAWSHYLVEVEKTIKVVKKQ